MPACAGTTINCLLNQQALQPRLALSRYVQKGRHVVLHVSYDRIFQTPSFENILLSSSPVCCEASIPRAF
jgi:hypothetical protein